MSPHLNTATRATLANLFAIIALLILALTPWLLSESSIQMSRSLTLPRALNTRIPEGCHSMALYVGYPGCNTECPRALSQIALTLSERPNTGELCAVFLSMFPSLSEEATRYAQRFHPKLIDVTLPAQSLSSMLRQLGAEGSLSPDGTHKDLIYTLRKSSGDWTLTEATPATQWSGERLGEVRSGRIDLKVTH